MKFSHILFSHLTPEWRAHYIDYDVRAFPLLFRARRGQFLVFVSFSFIIIIITDSFFQKLKVLVYKMVSQDWTKRDDDGLFHVIIIIF